jgi:hypothetical protein
MTNPRLNAPEKATHVKVDRIVRGAIADQGYHTLHKYVLFLHFLFDGLRRWYSDGRFVDVKQKRLKMSSRKSLPFPDDMIGLSKLGIRVGNQIVRINADPTLSKIKDDHSGNTAFNQQSTLVVPSDYFYFSNIYTSEGSGKVEVLRASNPHFTINWDAREFQFSSKTSDNYVYIEYVSNNFDPSTETIVPESIEYMMKQWIYYRYVKFKHGAAARETRAALLDFEDAKDDVRAEMSNLSGASIMEAANIHMTRNSINQ